MSPGKTLSEYFPKATGKTRRPPAKQWFERERCNPYGLPVGHRIQKLYDERNSIAQKNKLTCRHQGPCLTYAESSHEEPTGPLLCVSVAPSSKRPNSSLLVATGGDKGVVRVLTCPAKDESAHFQIAHSFTEMEASVNDICWRQDQRLLVAGGADSSGFAFDVTTGQQTFTFPLEHSLKTVNFLHGSPHVFVCGQYDATFSLWDTRSDTVCAEWKPRPHVSGSLNAVPLMLNPSHVATTSSISSAFKVWDIRYTGSRSLWAETPRFAQDAPTKKDNGASSLVLSPNGRRLYSLTSDSRHRTEYATIESRDLKFHSFRSKLAISPSNDFLSSSMGDGSVFVCPLGPDGVMNGEPAVLHDMHIRRDNVFCEVNGVDWAHDMVMSCGDDWGVSSCKFGTQARPYGSK